MTTLTVNKNGTTLVLSKRSNASADGTELVLKNNQGTTLISNEITQKLDMREKEVEVVEVGIQGPPGPTGTAVGGGGSTGTVYEIEIPAGQTRSVHTFDESVQTLRWDVAIENESLQFMTYQIKGLVSDPGTTFDWVKYTVMGSRLGHNTTYVFSGNMIDYQVTNTTTETLSLKVIAYTN